MTENYLPGMENTTLAPAIVSIRPPLDTSCNSLLTTPHKVVTSIVEVPSPVRWNLNDFWDDDGQDDGYDSDGKLGPLYDALEEEGGQYYDKDNTIHEQYYKLEYYSAIFELYDPVLEVATSVNITGDVETYACNKTGGNELRYPIPILSTKFSTLEKTECHFFQAGMSKNYYCTVECDNGQRSLDGKIVRGGAFYDFCRER